MTRHLAAPDRPVLCCKSSQWRASRTILAWNRAVFRHDLLTADSIRCSLAESADYSGTEKRHLAPVERILSRRSCTKISQISDLCYLDIHMAPPELITYRATRGKHSLAENKGPTGSWNSSTDSWDSRSLNGSTGSPGSQQGID